MESESLVDYLDEIPRYMAELRRKNRGLQGGDSISSIENINRDDTSTKSQQKENQSLNLIEQARKSSVFLLT